MTNVLIGIFIGLAAFLAAKFWLEKITPSPESEEKNHESPKSLKAFIQVFTSMAVVFLLLYALNYASHVVATTIAICLAACMSYFSGRGLFIGYKVREQKLQIQAGIFALLVIQFAGLAFGFVEYVNARTSVT